MVGEQEIVTENDLEHLLQLLEVGNATREWQSMMDKTTPNMSYQAWRHEPEVTLIRTLACFVPKEQAKSLSSRRCGKKNEIFLERFE